MASIPSRYRTDPDFFLPHASQVQVKYPESTNRTGTGATALRERAARIWTLFPPAQWALAVTMGLGRRRNLSSSEASPRVSQVKSSRGATHPGSEHPDPSLLRSYKVTANFLKALLTKQMACCLLL